eukprot:SAG22_NODE_330_length_12211_cov_6.451948_13_plen_274_part_00
MADLGSPLVQNDDAPAYKGQAYIPVAQSTITDRSLRNYNIAAFVLHFVQGTAMLVASQAVPSIKEFKKTLTTSFLDYDEETQALVPRSRDVFGVEIGLLAAVFVLLSALAHMLVLIKFDWYISGINQGINRLRWFEYALSSSVMICGIGILFGCYDLSSLILMFMVNASMNFFGWVVHTRQLLRRSPTGDACLRSCANAPDLPLGNSCCLNRLLMEKMNPPDRSSVDWSPFVYGCIAGVAPWIVVCLYFFGGGNFSRIPGFVYGILVGYFIFL